MKKRIILFEGMYESTAIIAFLTALSLKFSRNNQSIVCFQLLNSSRIKEIFQKYNIQTLRLSVIVNGSFLSSVKIVKLFVWLLTKDFESILNLFTYKGESFQDSFLDTITAKRGVLWKNNTFLKLFMNITYELIIFSFICNYVRKNRNQIDLIITGDSAYRYGYFAKLSSIYSIHIITNIDLNSICFNQFKRGYESKVTRPIFNMPIDDIIKRYPNFEEQIDDYFKKRVDGKILQHDVLKAYLGNDNVVIQDKYNCSNDVINVSVFAHVFSDAPRNIPNLIFDDFYDWFVATVKALDNNPNIRIFIKEHPSCDLYNNEKGFIKQILDTTFKDSKNIVLVENISPVKLIEMSDFIITASGTIGLEAVYFKKNVIIAAETAYSHLGLVHEFDNADRYVNYLINLSLDNKFDIDSRTAKLASFIYFLLYDNRLKYKDFPLSPYIRGEAYEISPTDFDSLLGYLCKETDFSVDLDAFYENNYEFFVPQINR